MKLLMTAMFLLLAMFAAAQPYNKDFPAVKDMMEKDGFTFMKMLAKEGQPKQGMIVEHMQCTPDKEFCFVGVQVHRPVDLHAVVTTGIPGAGSRIRNAFTVTERITDNGYDIYTSKAGVINNSGKTTCTMDIYFYDADDYVSDPAYLLVFEKPVK